MPVDPDRHLPDPGIDDSPTDDELERAADNVDVTEWVVSLANTGDDNAAMLAWAQDRYREVLAAVERHREAVAREESH
jgi:hypothetical protein